MSKFSAKLLVGAVVLLGILSQSVFVVQEGSRAIKLRFNKVIRDGNNQALVYEPGLHFKPPFIDSVVYLDARLQNLNENDERFLTIEKKDVLINSYVKWKVKDFDRFYASTSGGNYNIANDLLRRKINDTLRSEVGQQTISEIVSGTRGELMSSALKEINKPNDLADRLGIDVVDVRVNKIELPIEVSNSIYQRMRAERKAVAGEHRAKGQEEAQRITSETDRNVQVIIAEANLNAQKIRTQADAQAATLLNDTYAQSTDLFNFLKNLQSYKASISSGNTVLLVKPGKDAFYEYLFNNGLIKTTPNGKINPEVQKQISPIVTSHPTTEIEIDAIAPESVSVSAAPTTSAPTKADAANKPAVDPNQPVDPSKVEQRPVKD